MVLALAAAFYRFFPITIAIIGTITNAICTSGSVLATLNSIDSLGFFGGILLGELWQVSCIRRARNAAKLADLIF